MILALDPGTRETGWMLFSRSPFKIISFGKDLNDKIRGHIQQLTPSEEVVIEMIGHYGLGMPAGKEVFETCVWIGRFLELARTQNTPSFLVFRQPVKLHLCGSPRAKDGNVRQALVDRWGAPGTKKAPGFTYGISKDAWSALAIATYWNDKGEEVKREAAPGPTG